jgi:hypothetical protein
MAVNVDLIIPGLFDLPVDELDPGFLKLELPALNRFLRFSRPCQNQAFDLESMLIEAMGWTGLETLPFAQAYAGQEFRDSDNLLLFRAIHMKADMHNAIVVPLEENLTNDQDVDIIINDLKELFKVDCDITRLQNRLWLVHLKLCTPAQHYPHYLSVLGRKADPFIQQSKQALPWYKLMNEMQMFMHQHEINHNRFESALSPINSLWFWGAGKLSGLGTNNINWYCDDPLLKQFANVVNIDCAGLDDVRTTTFDRDSIIVDLSLLEALKSSGETGLQALLSNLEERLFNPLLNLIRARRCVLRLRSGAQLDLKMTAFSAYQWWKKSKSLVDRTGY